MTILKFVAYVWLFLMALTAFGLIFGYIVENKVPDNTRLKRWWRKNIVDFDPDDINSWKNFNG